MLTPAEIEALARKHGATSYRNRADTQHPAYGFSEAGLQALIAEAQAATLATVTPLVQKNCNSLENLLASVRGECPALLDEDRGGSAYLGMDADDSITAADGAVFPDWK